MKQNTKAFFSYSSRERKGILVLFSILIILSVLPHIYAPFSKTEKIDFTAIKNEIAANKAIEKDLPLAKMVDNKTENNVKTFEANLFEFDPNTASKEELLYLGFNDKTAQTLINFRKGGKKFESAKDLSSIYGIKKELVDRLSPFVLISKEESTPKPVDKTPVNKPAPLPKETKLFPFDPNTAEAEELSYLGLPAKAIKTLINFREKGATFRQPEDLGKVYGISKEMMTKLLPFIQIEKPANQFKKEKYDEPKPTATPKSPAKPIIVDINQATPEEWQQIKGIGPYRAKTITNFRSKLGGFISVSQIKETYGLPDSVFQQIKPFLVSSPITNKIDINAVNLKDLASHPYIDYKKANLIINYKSNHGPYNSADDLKKIKVFSEDFILKISPYLDFK